jgi:hypothetical protein
MMGDRYVGVFPDPYVPAPNYFTTAPIYYLGGVRVWWSITNLSGYDLTVYKDGYNVFGLPEASYMSLAGYGSMTLGGVEYLGMHSAGPFRVRICTSDGARATATTTAQGGATAHAGTATAQQGATHTATAQAGSTATAQTAIATAHTATAQAGSTATAQADSTATARAGTWAQTPIAAPTRVPYDGDGATCCTPVPQARHATIGPVPELGVVVPTFEPVQWVTATVAVSVVVITESVVTTLDALATPHAAVLSATARYSWESGAAEAAAWTETMSPSVRWLGIVNPASAAWTQEGYILWSLAPILKLLAPAIIVGILVVLARWWIYFAEWFRRIIDMIIKIIELIPGM